MANRAQLKFRRGATVRISQNGGASRRVAMAVPKGANIRVRGNSKIKVG